MSEVNFACHPVKPRMLYFQQAISSDLKDAYIQEAYFDRELKCMALFFDLTIVNQDGDYQEYCRKHRPDLCVFEMGTEFPRSLKINGAAEDQSVPKLGFLKTDYYAGSRSKFLAEIECYGVQEFFTWQPPALDYIDRDFFADKLFYWPFFVDGDVFKDYKLPKSVPVIFFGLAELGKHDYYPWRTKIRPKIVEAFPTLVAPHPRHSSVRFRVSGVKYAQMLNASRVSLTCGGFVNSIVAKHLEIAGTRCCLITERNKIVEEYGFVDGENCLFAEEDNAVEKVAYLLDNPDEQRRLADNAYALIQSKHLSIHRDQFRQWLELKRKQNPRQRIVQPTLFGPLELVDRDSEVVTSHPSSGSLDRPYLKEGDRLFREGRFRDAMDQYKKHLQFSPYIADHRLKWALCFALLGQADFALVIADEMLKLQAEEYKSPRQDPGEIFLKSFVLAIQGRRSDAFDLLERQDWRVHPLTKELISIWLPGEDARLSVVPPHLSIHVFPFRGHDDLKLLLLRGMLINKRFKSAGKLLWSQFPKSRLPYLVLREGMRALNTRRLIRRRPLFE